MDVGDGTYMGLGPAIFTVIEHGGASVGAGHVQCRGWRLEGGLNPNEMSL